MFQKPRKRKGSTMKMLENKSKLRSENKKILTFGFGSPKKSLQNVALNSELPKKKPFENPPCLVSQSWACLKNL
jgi:hypothetical protein